MKKLLTFIASLLALITLAACQTTTNSKSSESDKVQVTLTVAFSDTKTDTQTVTVNKDETVMDILKEYHEVKEEGGMVTAIDGVSQDATAKTYWMYDVNKELASKGAKEMTVKDGDDIKFYLETFE